MTNRAEAFSRRQIVSGIMGLVLIENNSQVAAQEILSPERLRAVALELTDGYHAEEILVTEAAPIFDGMTAGSISYVAAESKDRWNVQGTAMGSSFSVYVENDLDVPGQIKVTDYKVDGLFTGVVEDRILKLKADPKGKMLKFLNEQLMPYGTDVSDINVFLMLDKMRVELYSGIEYT